MSITLPVKATANSPTMRLRPWRPEDASELVEAHRDPLLRQWLTRYVTNGPEALRLINEQTEAWADGSTLFAERACPR
ncbi:MAG: GNAT family N-acetyltransferase [Stackebrandtia sp.]